MVQKRAWLFHENTKFTYMDYINFQIVNLFNPIDDD